MKGAAYYRDWRKRTTDPYKSVRTYQERNPKRVAYHKQKNHCKTRDIGFDFTLKEWVEWWGDDFELRGKGKGKLVMARFNDEGDYKPDNVRKLTQEENAKEYLERRYGTS